MISLLTGLAIYALTALTNFLQKKFNKNISMRLVVAILTVIGGGIYYAFQQSNPDALKQVVVFVSGAFATSQALWMAISKVIDLNVPKTDNTTILIPDQPTI